MTKDREHTEPETRSNLSRFINAQLMGKSFIIYGHLWLEHLMVRSLAAKLPNPKVLLANRNLGFSMLVALCESHAIIEPKLAEALRLVNAMRNKCAHKTTYKPSDAEWKALRLPLDALRGAGVVSNSDEWGEPLEVVAALLEQRARSLGANDLEAPLPDEDALDY